MESRSTLLGIRVHSRDKSRFSESTLGCWIADTLLSKMDQMQKSIGFRSGEYGGHSAGILVGWSGVLLKHPVLTLEVIICPGLQATCLKGIAVDFGIHFNSSRHKNERGATC